MRPASLAVVLLAALAVALLASGADGRQGARHRTQWTDAEREILHLRERRQPDARAPRAEGPVPHHTVPGSFDRDDTVNRVPHFPVGPERPELEGQLLSHHEPIRYDWQGNEIPEFALGDPHLERLARG